MGERSPPGQTHALVAAKRPTMLQCMNGKTRMTWPGRYEIFERGVSVVLLVGMIGVILIATVNFLVGLIPHFTSLDDKAMPYTVFQSLFDKALAAIIALELAHSVYQTALGNHALSQVRTVVIIGILAVVRKFVLIDIATVTGPVLIGLGVAILSLGAVFVSTYWIAAIGPRRGSGETD